jgi:hypothetical protein
MTIRVPTVRHGLAGLALCAALGLAYLPDLGHGFVKDDFMWIRSARIQSAGDAVGLFTQNVGFYRPIVAATFALDYALWGMEPLAYGITNLALLATGAWLLYLVARQLNVPTAAGALACALWVFNFHGINMAVLWISGRTSLLLSCTALAATLFVLRSRMMLGGLFCLLAMLSKEEAVVLPFLLGAWVYLTPSGTRRPAVRILSTWPLFAALAVYTLLRLQSGAFWPATAPSYYQLTAQPQVVFRNVLEYLDRGATWPAVVTVIVMAAARTLPVFTSEERRITAFGALWFACGYAITVFVPVRSSLYAVFPSIGACLAAAGVVAALMRSRPGRVRGALAVLSLVPLLLFPVFRARNEGLVAPAELSATVLKDLQLSTARFTGGARIVLVDDPIARFNLDAAFGALFPDAVALALGDRFQGEILSGAGDVARANFEGALVLALQNGRLEPYR